MKTAFNRDEIREIDRRAIEEYGMPGVILMENAGRGTAEIIISLGVHGRIYVCSGKGNNGGDGFVIARHLANYAYDVQVDLFCDPSELEGDACTNFKIIEKMKVPVQVWDTSSLPLDQLMQRYNQAEWLVDALFGTGLQGAPRAPYDQLIETINQSRAKVIAMDVPSGLDCNSGKPMGSTIRAEHTATFVANKIGYLQQDSQEWTGKVHVVDIGVPRELIDEVADS